MKNLPYRKNVVGIVRKVGNPEQGDKFLLVQLNKWENYFWKFPQGGVNDGETKVEALKREIKEELGSDKFVVIRQFPFSHQYGWDQKSIELAKFRWRGQKQTFFLVEFVGKKMVFDPSEIKNHCWVTKKEVLERIDIKYPIFKGYRKVIEKCLQNLYL